MHWFTFTDKLEYKCVAVQERPVSMDFSDSGKHADHCYICATISHTKIIS